jgi:glycosyltransferase involved in cell wall biosynthesis
LLFLGRLHPKKGLDRVLNCLRSVKRAIRLLVVAGNGDDGYTRQIRQLVSNSALEHHVLFAGHLDGEQLFLLPSRQENFTITVAEAMQIRLPVVISDKVNTWSYVKEARAGLVLDERDIDGLLPRAIEELLKDDGKRLSMGVQGSSFARARLTWHSSARALLNCYGRVLSTGNTQANCNGS